MASGAFFRMKNECFFFHCFASLLPIRLIYFKKWFDAVQPWPATHQLLIVKHPQQSSDTPALNHSAPQQTNTSRYIYKLATHAPIPNNHEPIVPSILLALNDGKIRDLPLEGWDISKFT
jgi:hypothetical protein